MSTRFDDLQAWLSQALKGRPFTLEPASTDASFRRYYRVHAPQGTYIAMDAPPTHEDCSPFIRVARLLQQAGINVPSIYHQDLNRGFLLIGDLGSEHYRDVLNADSARRLYGDAIGALLTMQACVPAETLSRYSEEILRDEMELFRRWFLQTHLGLTLEPRQNQRLSACFDLLCRSALEQPQVFVHRDYHSRNLMHCPQHNPGILDFQGALHGPLTYDLVSLLRDAYIRWPEERVELWLASYHGLAVQHGILPAQSRVPLRRWFDLMGVQRHLKVAGIFARLYHRDQKNAYLADIPLVMEHLVGVSREYAELHDLARLFHELSIGGRLRAANANVHGASLP